MIKAVYPGSFDPFTNGHRDILERALNIFDRVVVAIVRNPAKVPLFTFEERVEAIKASVEGLDTSRLEIDCFNSLLVDFMEKKQAKVMIKGLRAVSDFEFEMQMALMNRKLNNNVETIFLMTSSEYAFLSSSRVREIASLGGSVEKLVCPYVEKMLCEKFLHREPCGETIEKE